MLIAKKSKFSTSYIIANKDAQDPSSSYSQRQCILILSPYPKITLLYCYLLFLSSGITYFLSTTEDEHIVLTSIPLPPKYTHTQFPLPPTVQHSFILGIVSSISVFLHLFGYMKWVYCLAM